MDCEHALIEANTPCAYGYEYACVMGNGKATILEHTEEKRFSSFQTDVASDRKRV